MSKISRYTISGAKIVFMIEHLKNLDKNLDKNWTLVHKVIFAISVFLLYRVLIHSVDFDSMQTFNLIFVVIGFAVYSLKHLVKILLNSFGFFDESEKENKSKNNFSTYLALMFFCLGIVFIFLYYFTHIYGMASGAVISLNSGILVWIQSKGLHKKWFNYFIWIVIICGIISVFHSFYFNDLINIFSFLFIILFFIVDIYTEMRLK